MSLPPASPVRLALDELLRWHPTWDLALLDWQLIDAHSIDPEDTWQGRQHLGPWVLVEIGQPSETFDQTPAWATLSYAIFKRTGAIHDIGHDGAVGDDPIWSPASVARR